MLTDALRDAIGQRPARRYGRKQFLWRAGDARSGLWLVKSGAVKTYRLTPKGEEQITGFYLPGEFVGIDELAGETHRGYAQVTADCAVHPLPYPQLDALMDSGDVRRGVCQMMSECLRRNKVRFHQLSRLSAGERLAGLIYDIACRYGTEGGVMREFRLPVLRYDMANYTGLAPETVTREIHKMVDAGAFRFSGRTVSALCPDIMKTLTGERVLFPVRRRPRRKKRSRQAVNDGCVPG